MLARYSEEGPLGVNGGYFGYSGARATNEPGVVRLWALNVLARHLGSGARLLGFLTLFSFAENIQFWACFSLG
ncbi:hypothetical protein E1A91_A13G245300v1 [Gossypium mustelinum]|uniref:Uncharacterized protein n=1 Tax=Gossypium mustelinum TaxID=34275 RepID=A0A5D2WLW0_GOSMU|nr:hypothetical protein E1A91_A13G245300v1 [Gossypium mustelinum]